MSSSITPQQLLTLDAAGIADRYKNKSLTVVEVIKATQQCIKEDNTNGHQQSAIISVAPEAELLKLASQLDKELAENHSRGPLHGIPVVVKVS